MLAPFSQKLEGMVKQMSIISRRVLCVLVTAAMGVPSIFVSGAAASSPRTTTAQRNAIAAAQGYLSEQSFSKAGLIQQLASSAGEGYGEAVAVYAVDHIKVNWNNEAVADAKQYLQLQPFSKVGLTQQLDSSAGEGFTVAQANYALAHIKVNWFKEAVADAKQYLKQQPFSCQGLVQQLDSSAGEGFTVAQATYAAKKVGIC
jgi:Host cell surface-exposed lipoprotein